VPFAKKKPHVFVKLKKLGITQIQSIEEEEKKTTSTQHHQ
jgi:hypothetical protein